MHRARKSPRCLVCSPTYLNFYESIILKKKKSKENSSAFMIWQCTIKLKEMENRKEHSRN